MENDVRLLQQLLALGDSIQELKCRSRTDQQHSRISLNSLDEEDSDEELWSSAAGATFSNSMSAVTNLYVDDEPNDSQTRQYFSRKNSVLRIPIPPRSSNRMSTNKKLQRRLSRLSQHYYEHQQQQQRQQRPQVVESSSQTTDEITVNLAPTVVIPNTSQVGVQTTVTSLTITTNTAAAVSGATATAVATTTATMALGDAAFGTMNTRVSNGSIDSGIRDESSSNYSSAGSLSPTLKDEKF